MHFRVIFMMTIFDMRVFDYGHVHHLAFSLIVAGAYVYSQIVNLMPNFGIAQKRFS